jgi:hypothetical protein
MNGGSGDERCFWQIAHLLFIVFFFPPSLFLIPSALPFFQADSHVLRRIRMHIRTYSFLSDLAGSSTPSSQMPPTEGRVGMRTRGSYGRIESF